MDESISPQGKNTIRGICLAAGIIGGIWLGLGLITFLFVIGEGIKSSQRNPNEPIDIFGILIIISFIAGLAGIVLAYWKEGLGGLISFLGIFIAGALLIINPKLDFNIIFFIIAILLSVLFIASWWHIKESIQIILQDNQYPSMLTRL